MDALFDSHAYICQHMIIISAMSENRVIGRGDQMPWSVPEEYQQYLDFVDGQTVIMGRKTYDVFASDLSDQTTAIVVTRSKTHAAPHVASSLDAAIRMADEIGKTVFIAGGATIYQQALPLADEMYLSTIKGEFEGDTSFPPFDDSDWEVVEEKEAPRFIFRHYRRIQRENS